MKVYTSAEQLIGRTPLMRLCNVEKRFSLDCRLLAKLEFYNPAGSVKDRVAKKMIDDAVASGKLQEGGVIIEPTSGNTGIGLAAVATARGYECIIVMPDTMSKERCALISAFGAKLVLSDGALGMAGCIAKAEELCASIPGSIIMGQFVNPSNPAAHYESTGPEIWEDCDGDIDIFVAGVGTGGTLSGTAKYLKEQNKNIKVIAVEPAASPLLSGGKAGPHGLQGIGANFIPDTLDRGVIDEVLPVTDKAAYEAARMIGKTEGILVGISAGAALHAAIETAKNPENAGKTIVFIVPDSGDRYLSTGLFE